MPLDGRGQGPQPCVVAELRVISRDAGRRAPLLRARRHGCRRPDRVAVPPLKPQATTNPGTKDLPYVYFGKIKDWKGFEQFRKFQYPSRYYVLVPESSADGQQISWRSTGLGGDYVKVSPLEPDTTQYVVDISQP
jgi:hypothetical protein